MTRIAIISDIHFGKFSRTLDFAVPGEIIQDQSEDIMPFEEGLRALLSDMKPDYFFLAGDLTSIGNPKEFIYCEKKIVSLAECIGLSPTNIICGLGNHDIDWSISDLGRLNNSDHSQQLDIQVSEKYQYMAANCAKFCLDTILEPKKTGPVVFSGITESRDFIVFILNTSLYCGRDEEPSRGKVGAKQLEWFGEVAKQYKNDSRTKILLMHHHPRTYAYPIPTLDISTIEEGAEIIDIANNMGINIIIHGHRHHPYVETVQTASGTRPISIICAGSLSVNADYRNEGEIPNTIHFLDVDSGRDYYELYNYQYTGPEGWKPLIYNSKTAPLDHKMKIGKITNENHEKEAIKKYADLEDDLIRIKWEELDECLHFKLVKDVNEKFKEILSDRYSIIGKFPEEVALIKRREIK